MPEEKVKAAITAQYKALEKKYATILFSFVGVFIAETILFIVFIPFLLKTALFSFILALWLASFFGYFIARNYLVSERTAAYEELIERFKRGIQSLYPRATPLELKERTAQEMLTFSDSFKAATGEKVLSRLSNLLQNYPRFAFRLALTLSAKDEITGMIRIDPCSLPAHLAMAETKMFLALLHQEQGDTKAYTKLLEESAEEFKVLVGLSPDDPALYLNLAECHRQLQNPVAEKESLEKAKGLAPDHPDILFRLGQLYFAQSETAKGFQIYESLRRINPSKSEALIAFYK
jgi:tetratricopeptide (TPR) repeat protein